MGRIIERKGQRRRARLRSGIRASATTAPQAAIAREIAGDVEPEPSLQRRYRDLHRMRWPDVEDCLHRRAGGHRVDPPSPEGIRRHRVRVLTAASLGRKGCRTRPTWSPGPVHLMRPGTPGLEAASLFHGGFSTKRGSLAIPGSASLFRDGSRRPGASTRRGA